MLLEVIVDRRRPGEADEIALSMQWPDRRLSTVRFFGCYSLKVAMNFGVVAEETVRAASESHTDEELRERQATWAKLGVDISDLNMFQIETNSTASNIVILAQGWREEAVAGCC